MDASSTPGLSVDIAEKIGSAAFSGLAVAADGVSEVVFTVASIVASLAVELVAGIWGAIDSILGDADHQLVLTRATAYSAYFGRWHAHDYELCAGQALDFAAYDRSTGEMPCTGSGASGYERMRGCGYAAGGRGFAWVPLTFACHADGTVTTTAGAAPVPVPSPVGGAFYDDSLTVCALNGADKIVPCNGGIAGIPPEGIAPGSGQLSIVKAGVLKETLPQGYWSGLSYDVCSPYAPQADQLSYCPNG